MLEKKASKIVENMKDIPKDYFQKNQIDNVHFKNLSFSGERFSQLNIKSSEFEACSFDSCIFNAVDFQRVDFTRCSFSNSAMDTKFRYITGSCMETVFENCDFSGAFIQNVRFESVFTRTEFNNLKAKSIDFSGSDFRGIQFDGSHIVRGNFRNVNNLKRNLFHYVRLEDSIFDWNECFVIMKFGKDEEKNNFDMDNYYNYCIEPVLKDMGVEPVRVDKLYLDQKITDVILEKIKTCRFVVAECSARSLNVFFEIGYALGNDKRIIFCIDSEDNIPFDLKDYQFIIHGTSFDGFRNTLRKHVEHIMSITT
jgi:hypothetical protein